jgi:hypothetical protein
MHYSYACAGVERCEFLQRLEFCPYFFDSFWVYVVLVVMFELVQELSVAYKTKGRLPPIRGGSVRVAWVRVRVGGKRSPAYRCDLQGTRAVCHEAGVVGGRRR